MKVSSAIRKFPDCWTDAELIVMAYEEFPHETTSEGRVKTLRADLSDSDWNVICAAPGRLMESKGDFGAISVMHVTPNAPAHETESVSVPREFIEILSQP